MAGRLGTWPDKEDEPIESRTNAVLNALIREQDNIEATEEELKVSCYNVILAVGDFLGAGIYHLKPEEILKLKSHLSEYSLGHLLD